MLSCQSDARLLSSDGCNHAGGKLVDVEACLPEQIVQTKADGSPQGNGIGGGDNDPQIYEGSYDCLCISAIHAVEELQQAATPGRTNL